MTSEEFIIHSNSILLNDYSLTDMIWFMDHYAKHVLEIAAEKATMTLEESSDDPYDHYAIVDKNSILNCLKEE